MKTGSVAFNKLQHVLTNNIARRFLIDKCLRTLSQLCVVGIKALQVEL